jgi:glycosyltransferase involved in cell wall biosynthesis
VSAVPPLPVPAVSIVLATRDRLALLRLTIDSVLAQTFTDWELVIADDGSAAETRSYLLSIEAAPRIRVIWLDHCGNPGAVRNVALAGARGRFVAFLDSDDLWMPDKLARQLQALRAAPGFRWSYTGYECIDAQGDPLAISWQPHPDGIVESLLRLEAMIALPTVMAERSLLIEAGGFDVEQRQAEDHELWLRLGLRSEVLLVPEALTRVRFHPDHYCRGGVWGLDWLRRMYEKIETLAPKEVRHTVRRARTRNAARLMRAHAASRDWRALVDVASRTIGFSWRAPAWWSGLFKACVKLLVPRSWFHAARRALRPA